RHLAAGPACGCARGGRLVHQAVAGRPCLRGRTDQRAVRLRRSGRRNHRVRRQAPPEVRVRYKEPFMTIADLDFQTLRLSEPAANVALLTLNRPDRFNAMTPRMFTELEQAATVLNDDDALRVLVITGAGKAFCSGYDLAEADKLPELGAIGMLDLQERAARAMLAVRNVRVPVIAAVNGPAAGGGLALALQADIRIAAPEATFVPAMVRVGLSIGDLGVSWLLPRLIGPARASEIAFTGRDVDAAEAERIGLVNALSRPGELMNDVLAL